MAAPSKKPAKKGTKATKPKPATKTKSSKPAATTKAAVKPRAAKIKVPKGGIKIGGSYDFDPLLVARVNAWFDGSTPARRRMDMPMTTTPDNFNIRWLIALRSRAFPLPAGEDPLTYYMEPWEADDRIQTLYDQINTMVHLCAARKIKALFGVVTVGSAAHVLITEFIARINSNPHIPVAQKADVIQTFTYVRDFLKAKYPTLRFRQLFKKNLSEDLLVNVIGPLVHLRKVKGVKVICIPFIRKHINLPEPAEDELDYLADFSPFQAHLTPKIGQRLTTEAKARSLKSKRPKRGPYDREFGDVRQKGDPGGNNYQCQEYPLGSNEYKCRRLTGYYCNPTPNGSCSIV